MSNYIRNMLILLIGSFLFKIAIADPMRSENNQKSAPHNVAIIR